MLNDYNEGKQTDDQDGETVTEINNSDLTMTSEELYAEAGGGVRGERLWPPAPEKVLK